MKKTIILVIFAAFLSISQAQFVRGYGVKAGATFAAQDWDYTISGASFETDTRTGFNIGLFAELLDIPLFSIVTEANYVQKGLELDMPRTTVEQPEGDGVFTVWDSRIDYINISALAKLRLNCGLVTPYIIAGPKIDFEVNKSGGTTALEDGYEKNRFGLKAGMGAEIKLLSLNLLAEILYDVDLNNLYENDKLEINTSSVDLRIGVFF